MENYLKDYNLFHDCQVLEIIYDGKTICFITSVDKQNGMLSDKTNKLKIKFVLSSEFIDESYIPAVQIINQQKWRNKGVVKYATLKQFVNFIKTKKCEFVFYECYFNQNKCLIIGWLDKGRKSSEVLIELLIKDVIYEKQSGDGSLIDS